MYKAYKVALSTLALCLSTPAWAAGADWKVSEASGRVVTRDASGDHPISRGSVIPAGATVVTGAGARAVLVRGDDFVTVSAASRIRVPDAQSTSMVQMFMEWGTGLFKVKHTDKPHFGVKTPYLAAVVKGTTFTVTVGQDGSSLQVLDGAVGVATIDGGANELIRPGMVAMVGAGDQYRLTVQGQNSRTIDSPMRGSNPTPTTEASPRIGEASPKVENAALPSSKSNDDFAWSEVASSVITAPVEAKPVDLGTVTGGLVTNGGSTAVVAMSAATPVVPGPAVDSGRATNEKNSGPNKIQDDAKSDVGKGKDDEKPEPRVGGKDKPEPGMGNDDAKPDASKGKDDAKPEPGVGSGKDKPEPGKGSDDAKPDAGKGKDDGKPEPGVGGGKDKPEPGKGSDDAKPDAGKGKDDAKPEPDVGGGKDKPEPGKGSDDAKPDASKDKDDAIPEPGVGGGKDKPEPGKGSDDAKPDAGKGKDDAKPEPDVGGGKDKPGPGKGSDDAKPDASKGKDDAKPEPDVGGGKDKPEPGTGNYDAKPDAGKGIGSGNSGNGNANGASIEIGIGSLVDVDVDLGGGKGLGLGKGKGKGGKD